VFRDYKFRDTHTHTPPFIKIKDPDIEACIPIIEALRRLRQEDLEFKGSLTSQ
jgi:hypothetical protein